MSWKDDFYYDIVHIFNKERDFENRKNLLLIDNQVRPIIDVPKLSEVRDIKTKVEFYYDLDEAGFSEKTKLEVVDEYGLVHWIVIDCPLHVFMKRVEKGKVVKV